MKSIINQYWQPKGVAEDRKHHEQGVFDLSPALLLASEVAIERLDILPLVSWSTLSLDSM